MSHDDDRAAVEAVLSAWTTAIERGDLEGVLANHPDDVVMFDVPPPLAYVGTEEYRTSWELFFSFQQTGVFILNNPEIVVGSDVAFCHSLVTCGTHDPASQFQVRLTVGLRKIDGRWLITHEHHSVPAETS